MCAASRAMFQLCLVTMSGCLFLPLLLSEKPILTWAASQTVHTHIVNIAIFLCWCFPSMSSLLLSCLHPFICYPIYRFMFSSSCLMLFVSDILLILLSYSIADVITFVLTVFLLLPPASYCTCWCISLPCHQS